MIRAFNFRKYKAPLIVLLIIAISITGYFAFFKRSSTQLYSKQYKKIAGQCTHYDIYADFNPENKSINAVQTVRYKTIQTPH